MPMRQPCGGARPARSATCSSGVRPSASTAARWRQSTTTPPAAASGSGASAATKRSTCSRCAEAERLPVRLHRRQQRRRAARPHLALAPIRAARLELPGAEMSRGAAAGCACTTGAAGSAGFASAMPCRVAAEDDVGGTRRVVQVHRVGQAPRASRSMLITGVMPLPAVRNSGARRYGVGQREVALRQADRRDGYRAGGREPGSPTRARRRPP